MLIQWPRLNCTNSNGGQVYAQGDDIKSDFIQSASDNTAKYDDVCNFESDVERLELFDPLPAGNKDHFPVPQTVEGGAGGSNAMNRVSNAVNKWLVSTVFPCGSIPAIWHLKILSFGKEPR
jgi:hypothetical protein